MTAEQRRAFKVKNDEAIAAKLKNGGGHKVMTVSDKGEYQDGDEELDGAYGGVLEPQQRAFAVRAIANDSDVIVELPQAPTDAQIAKNIAAYDLFTRTRNDTAPKPITKQVSTESGFQSVKKTPDSRQILDKMPDLELIPMSGVPTPTSKSALFRGSEQKSSTVQPLSHTPAQRHHQEYDGTSGGTRGSELSNFSISAEQLQILLKSTAEAAATEAVAKYQANLVVREEAVSSSELRAYFEKSENIFAQDKKLNPDLGSELIEPPPLLQVVVATPPVGQSFKYSASVSMFLMIVIVVCAYVFGPLFGGVAAAAATSGVRNNMPHRRVVLMGRGTHGDNSSSSSGPSYNFNISNPNNAVFDNGSDVHLSISPHVLTDMRSCRPGSLGGIVADDSSLKFNQTGTFAGTRITDVFLCEGAVANIISPAMAMDQGYQQQYLQDEDMYVLTHRDGGPPLKFARVDLGNGNRTKRYFIDLRTFLPPVGNSSRFTVAVATIKQNMSRYTKQEVRGAEKALRFLDCIGSPPLTGAIQQLRATLNPPVSEADVRRCYDIYGPRVSSLKATTTKQTTAAARTDTHPPDEVPTSVYLEVDIMFIKRRVFLVGVAEPIDFAMCIPLVHGRNATQLQNGLKSMTAKLKSRNFVCSSIRSDNEGGIVKESTVEELQRLCIELPVTGAGSHCPHIERRIRGIKQNFRRHEHRLPFAMNGTLVDFGALAATRETNMRRTKSSTSLLSPREKFMGRAYDFKRDGRVPFGTYIQMTVRETDNTSRARTEGCIALIPRDNLTGSIYAYHIATQCIIVRDHFVEVPMSDALINYMDGLAAKDGLSRGCEPFRESEYSATSDDEVDEQEIAINSKKPVVAFKPFNQPSVAEPEIIIEGAVSAEQLPQIFQPSIPIPPVGAGVTTALGGRGAANTAPRSKVIVEDVNEEDDSDAEDDAEEDTPSNEPLVIAQPQPQAQAPRATNTGAQLYRGRGAAQTNSLARLGGPTAMLVGTNFNDPVFESKFNAQLWHTRDWHDRSFAFVISWGRAIKAYGEPARRSIELELQQMIDKKVWHPVSLKGLSKEQRKAVIRAKMFVTEKFFPNGGFDKIKSRLVARGDMQDRSLYGDDDTSAPTAELSSVFSVAAIAACESRYVATCDIGGAFLNADMFKGSGRTVIVKLDPQITKMLTKLKPDYEAFVGDDGHLFVELDKAMYGCIESAKLWFEHLRGVLVNDMGFVQNACDGCTFNKTDDQGIQVTVILHVDDMKITCANKITLDAVLLSLCSRFKETKSHYGPCVPFLGMDFDYTIPGEVRITMAGMEADILATSGVNGVAVTPATEALFEVDTEKQPVEEQDEQDWFRSNVAKLLYLGKRARPEILTATTFLATRAAKADTDDMGKLRRVIRYLRGSAGRGIRLRPGALGVNVRAYVDAAYGVHVDGKSHTGVSIVIGEAGPIFVRSSKQPIVAKSSTEAELIATSDSANQVFHVRNFIISQGYGDKPATIFQDNMSCMSLLAKGKSTSMRTRHISIRYYWVKERVENGEAVITHMRSEAMGPANALTKPLVGSQFVEERRQLTNWD
jgi:hypothetical protein